MEAQFEVFTEAVKAQQSLRGSREGYARFEAKRGWKREVTPDLASMLCTPDFNPLCLSYIDRSVYFQAAT